jgi:hypothetical protein
MVRQIGASPGDSGWGKYAVIANPMSNATSAHGSLVKFFDTFPRMDRTMPLTPEESRVSPASPPGPPGGVVLATLATTVRPRGCAWTGENRRADAARREKMAPERPTSAVDDEGAARERAAVDARAGAAALTAATRVDAPIANIFARAFGV